jgi:hypothetical protein
MNDDLDLEDEDEEGWLPITIEAPRKIPRCKICGRPLTPAEIKENTGICWTDQSILVSSLLHKKGFPKW